MGCGQSAQLEHTENPKGKKSKKSKKSNVKEEPKADPKEEMEEEEVIKPPKELEKKLEKGKKLDKDNFEADLEEEEEKIKKELDEEEKKEEIKLQTKENEKIKSVIKNEGYKEKTDFDFLRKIQKNNDGVAKEIIQLLERLKPKENYFKSFESGEKFTDQDFPADTSVLGSKYSQEEMKKYSFKRLPEITSDYVVHDKITPHDIKQTALGDCYFICVIAAMGEFPERVKKIFTNQNIGAGCYELKVFFNGGFTRIVLDDYFPCIYENKLAYANLANNQIWGILLEKAWAKVNGNYSNIEAGATEESLTFLTGAPCEYFNLESYKEEKEKKLFWEKLKNSDKNNYILTASVGDGGDTQGLIGSHAYSLISAFELQHQGKDLKLLKIRNPWGHSEWTGNWSDKSASWTPDLKTQVNFVDENDGTFFIDYDDFLKHYSSVTICYYKDNYYISSIRSSSPKDDFAIFKMKVSKPSKGFLVLTQIEKRMVRETYPNFKASNLLIVLVKIFDNGAIKFMQASRSSRPKIAFENETLEAGNYMVLALGDWEIKGLELFSVYAYLDSEVDFAECEDVNEQDIINELMESYLIQNCEKNTLEKIGMPNAVYYGGLWKPMGWYMSGIWMKNNETKGIANYRVQIKSFSGYLLPPYEGKKDIEISLKPGEEGLILAKSNEPFSWGGSYVVTPVLYPDQISQEDLIDLIEKNSQYSKLNDEVGYRLWFRQNGFNYLLLINNSEKNDAVASFTFTNRRNCELVNPTDEAKGLLD